MTESSDRCREPDCGSGRCSCGFKSRFGYSGDTEPMADTPSSSEDDNPNPCGTFLLLCPDCGETHLDIRLACEPGVREKYQQDLAVAREREDKTPDTHQPQQTAPNVSQGCLLFLGIGVLFFLIMFWDDIAFVWKAFSDAAARTFPN